MAIICKECGKKGLNGAKGLCFDCYNRLKARKQYCTVKRKEYAKKYNEEHKEMRNKSAKESYNKNKEKRIIVMMDYQRGKIKKVECEICKSKDNLEYHHIKYDRKESIIQVLCRTCHRKLHRR